MIADLDIKPFSLSDLPDFQDSTTTHFFKPGQIIFYEGHMPYGLFILLDGTIEMSVNDTSSKIEGNAILGINSFLNSLFYCGTARAITACKVYFLSKTSFQDLLGNNQVVSWIGQ